MANRSGKRFAVAIVSGVGVGAINVCGVLNWLPPTIIGGRWILGEISVCEALLTHLVFAWTMLLMDQGDEFVREPRLPISESKADRKPVVVYQSMQELPLRD